MDLFEDEDDALLGSLPLDDLPVLHVNGKLTSQGKQNCCLKKGSEKAAVKEIKAELEIPCEFPFPFEPYDIQVGFMKSLYECLETGKIGIFESPTGTGKSLSLICGALTWLTHFEEKQKEEFELLTRQEVTKTDKTKVDKSSCKVERNEETKELDWITEFSQKLNKEEQTKQLKEDREAIIRKEKKLEELKNELKPHRGKRKREKLDKDFDELMKSAPKKLQDEFAASVQDGDSGGGLEFNNDEEIIVADYNSDDGKEKSGSSSEEEEEEPHVVKIYYCSRTHSQLSQFVREIMKSPFGESTRVVSLGSRQNMCINDAVKKLKALSLINDKCLDLQKNKKGSNKEEDGVKVKRRKSEGVCPYYNADSLLNYRDRILVDVNDIEQLVTLGKRMKACPYYGSRLAIPTAQVVALPYNTILHKSTREACGIKLAGNVVVIDEAHNLLETINNIHSVEVWGNQLTQTHSQLSQYFHRYQSRLKAKNLLYIKQLLFVLQGFLQTLGGKPGVPADEQWSSEKGTKLETINNFLFQSNLDNVNLFKVKRYCKRSQISKKLNGFVEKYQPQIIVPEPVKVADVKATSGVSRFLKEIVQHQATKKNSKIPEVTVKEDEKKINNNNTSMKSPLMHIEGFLEALTNADKDGRVVINKQNVLSKSSIKFLLLNPAVHFASILEEARAVIVAGGTMQPVSEFKDQLFHAVGVSPDRILEYSCGHVIPDGQLLPIALSKGPTGVDLDFTFQSRNNPELLDDLGRLILNVCNVVPGGVVTFFPSYDYQRVVYSHWENTGYLRKINLKKKVFQEPKLAGQVDMILSQYTDSIQKPSSDGTTGALLFCVVGGKMSEGINFADEMGRCVLMVGLPYPNMYSPELKEKMTYLNANFPKSEDGRQPGQVHYENLCMKAVNQSIGRAIRHKTDYACIVLLDQRYSRGNVISKLPQWISKHLVKMERFGPSFGAVNKFFMDKRR